MKVNQVFTQTAYAVGIVLVGLTAIADEVNKGTSKISTTIEVEESPTALKHKTVPTVPMVAPSRTGAAEVVDIGKLEMVTARYPDGKVKIEREVGQDAAGNYINQGTYKQYAPSGEVVRTGEFLNGKQQGKWTQRFAGDEGHLFSASLDKQWSGPFISEASFQDGRLHGAWTIKDSHGQNIFQWSFDNGAPVGTWTWWHPNGQKSLEATFSNGVLNGTVTEWDSDAKVLNQDSYTDGKYVVKAVGWYALGRKRFEGAYLRSCDMPKATYDWWNGKIDLTPNAAGGPDVQHGRWTEWYPSGNKRTEGEFDRGVTVGKISWWYENGQMQAEGEYEAGKKNGTWITWHPNGLKESVVEYKAGKRMSDGLEWTADGKVIESHAGQAASTPRVAERPTATY